MEDKSDLTNSIHQMEQEQIPELTAGASVQTNKNKNKKILMIIACVVLGILMSITIGVTVNNTNGSSDQNAVLSPIDTELPPIDTYEDKPSLSLHDRLLVPADYPSNNPSNNPSVTPQSALPPDNPSGSPQTGFPSDNPSQRPLTGFPSNNPQSGSPSDSPSVSDQTNSPNPLISIHQQIKSQTAVNRDRRCIYVDRSGYSNDAEMQICNDNYVWSYNPQTKQIKNDDDRYGCLTRGWGLFFRPCSSDAENQKWIISGDTIRAYSGNQCIDILWDSGTATLFPAVGICDSSISTQKWIFYSPTDSPSASDDSADETSSPSNINPPDHQRIKTQSTMPMGEEAECIRKND